MILENETFKTFGYHSYELTPKSSKKILVRCNECGKVREISKSDYRDLCKSCVRKGEANPMYGKFHTKESKEKMSERFRGKPLSEEHKRKITKGLTGRKHSEETKKKMSIAQKGRTFSEESIQKMRDAQKGEKSWNWQGGISFEPYCSKFNTEFKEKIREKFNRKCFLCGISEEENNRKLSVHHVNYDKQCLCNDTKCEFVPLCVSCHNKTNHNRKYYENLISNKLNK